MDFLCPTTWISHNTGVSTSQRRIKSQSSRAYGSLWAAQLQIVLFTFSIAGLLVRVVFLTYRDQAPGCEA